MWPAITISWPCLPKGGAPEGAASSASPERSAQDLCSATFWRSSGAPRRWNRGAAGLLSRRVTSLKTWPPPGGRFFLQVADRVDPGTGQPPARFTFRTGSNPDRPTEGLIAGDWVVRGFQGSPLPP